MMWRNNWADCGKHRLALYFLVLTLSVSRAINTNIPLTISKHNQEKWEIGKWSSKGKCFDLLDQYKNSGKPGLSPGGVGGTPSCRYLPPQKGMVFLPFQSENWYGLCPLWSGIGYVVWVYKPIYRFNSKWIRKEGKYANSKWILSNLFCWCTNLSSDDTIS